MPNPVIEKINAEQAKLFALLEPLEESNLDIHYGDGWTIREILTHLINAEEDHCRIAAIIARGQQGRLPTSIDLASHNQERVAARGHMSKVELLAALQAQRVRTEQLMDGMSAEQLEMAGTHPVIGDTTVSKIFRIIGIHSKIHYQEIAEAIQGQG